MSQFLLTWDTIDILCLVIQISTKLKYYLKSINEMQSLQILFLYRRNFNLKSTKIDTSEQKIFMFLNPIIHKFVCIVDVYSILASILLHLASIYILLASILLQLSKL